jgi:hypothetical protein
LSHELAIKGNTEVFALPEPEALRHQLKKIKEFQEIVHATLIVDQDYGVIPGTDKPTLLKPGAEKIAKILGLADEYEIVEKVEDWNKPLFRYMVKCKLISMQSGVLVSSGMGECNTMESKYRYRWVYEDKLPAGVKKESLVSQKRKSKSGGSYSVYRLDNEDIFSQVNTVLKMATKRALVAATLSAGRLSNVFTQDIEDMPEFEVTKEQPPIKTEPTPPAITPPATPQATAPEIASQPPEIDFDKKGEALPLTPGGNPWILAEVARLGLTEEKVLKYINETLHLPVEATVDATLTKLTADDKLKQAHRLTIIRDLKKVEATIKAAK